MRKFLIILLCALLAGCAEFRPSWIHENSFVQDKDEVEITPDDFDGPLGGHFDAEGNWVPDDPTIEWTYKIPDISAGFLFDVSNFDELEITPVLQIELFEFDIPYVPYLRTWKLDCGIGYMRAYGYLGPRITSIFEISIGVTGGWNFENESWFIGPTTTLIKF